MKIEKVIKELEQNFPPELAMSWDNSGLQVGNSDYEVKKAVIALDATEAVIAFCREKNADLLITHHPLMLDGIRQVNSSGMYGRKILQLAENKIAHYAMHTNYDVAMMADLADRALKLKKLCPLETTAEGADGTAIGIGSVGELSTKSTAGDCCELVKKVFDLDCVRLYGEKDKKVKRIAVCPGSGNSMIKEALAQKADLFITGDISHHSGLDAVDQGMAVIDAGHYGIEQIFIAQTEALMKEKFPEIKIKTFRRSPFETI